MKSLFAILFTALLFLTTVKTGNAITINFDDYALGHTAIILGNYKDLSWNNIVVYDGYNDPLNFVSLGLTGIHSGVVSPNYIASNINGDDAAISSLKPFNFTSAYLTGLLDNGFTPNKVKVTGIKNNIQKYTRTVDVTLNPTLFMFEFNNIDRLVFHSYIKPDSELEDLTQNFIMDDLTYDFSAPAPAPEPTSILLGIIGLGGLFGIKRKRNNLNIA